MKNFLRNNKGLLIASAILLVLGSMLTSFLSIEKGKILSLFFGIMLVVLFFGIQLLLLSCSERKIIRYLFLGLIGLGYISLIILSVCDRYEGAIVAISLGFLLFIGMGGTLYAFVYYKNLTKENAADLRIVKRSAVKLSLGCIVAAVLYFIILFSIT